jgi:hypothetical protein
MILAIANPGLSSPNVIQIQFANLVLPFAAGESPFDPTTDITVFVDGQVVSVQNFYTSAANASYFLYLARSFSSSSVIQAIYHIPEVPFLDAQGWIVPGFALLAMNATA